MRKSSVTFATCLIFVLAYAVEMSQGGGFFSCPPEVLTRMGASTGHLTIDAGQYYRMLSCIFVHANMWHLALNIYALVDFGPTAEANLGRKLYLFVFYFSGIVGALASILYNPTQTSVGASAAILGLLGALIYKNWFDKDGARFSRPQLVMLCIFLAYSLLLGFTTNVIDNAAHLGGFFAGMAVCAALFGTKAGQTPDRKRVLIASATLVASLFALLTWANVRVHNNPDVEAFLLQQEAAALVKKKDYKAALEKLNRAQGLALDKCGPILVDRSAIYDQLDNDQSALDDITARLAQHPRDVSALMSEANYLHKLNRNDEAVAELTKALEIKPTNIVEYCSEITRSPTGEATLYNNRAWFKLSAGKAREALADCARSLELDPHLNTVYDTRGLAFYMLKNYDRAQSDFTRSIELEEAQVKRRRDATVSGAGYYHRALARFALGDKAGGNSDMERFKTLDYKLEPWEPKP